MLGLTALRQDWEAIEVEETRLLRRMTVQESLRQWLMLQSAFEPQLQATDALFAEERRACLGEPRRGLPDWQNGRNEMEQLFRSVKALQQRLSDAGIPSIVIGGAAVGTWGEPRRHAMWI